MGQYLGLIGQKVLAIKVDKDFIVTHQGFKIRRISTCHLMKEGNAHSNVLYAVGIYVKINSCIFMSWGRICFTVLYQHYVDLLCYHKQGRPYPLQNVVLRSQLSPVKCLRIKEFAYVYTKSSLFGLQNRQFFHRLTIPCRITWRKTRVFI